MPYAAPGQVGSAFDRLRASVARNTLERMIQRGFVDYTLRRRALLREFAEGRVSRDEVCDAQSYLKQAARFHGEPAGQPCPVCGSDGLALVHYVYGDRWKVGSGQAKAAREIAQLSERMSDFNVYVVEVCDQCGWNHLRESFSTGIEQTPRRSRRRTPAKPNVAIDLNDL